MTYAHITPYEDRLRFAAIVVAPILALGMAVRFVLYASFHDGEFRPFTLLLAIAVGGVLDAMTILVALLPLWLALACLRLSLLRIAALRAVFLAGAYAGLVFLAVAEYFFFEEFNARFNHIALDYVLFPHEVFFNLWESYNVPLVVASCVAAGVVLAWPAVRWTKGAQFGPLPFGARWKAACIVLIAAGLSLFALVNVPAGISRDRITAEITHNGLTQLARAFMTADLDYPLYYRTLPADEAHRRAAEVLGFPAPVTGGPADQFRLQKHLTAAASGDAPKPWDVVVILEESFGSEFVGVLGHPERGLSPHFDRWSKEGTLLTQLTATGNRTVRGLEGVLCSFVPLPGDSIVKRTHAPRVATVARIFQARNYRTAFFYGGIGLFDHMKPFLTANGYDEFVEQGDYPAGAFKTAWGVADEYIFDALLKRQLDARERGERLFATLLSVSNHKPYDVPEGRTGRPTGERSREGAVAYADWALGRYLDQAREDGLLDHTLVLVVGDHGARVYGSEQIPTHSYRIPGLFLTPDPRSKGRRIDRLCSQVDLAPTLLSLCGVECEAPFFGQDVSGLPADGGRAFVHHNRDVGILTDDALVVLGLQKSATYYHRSGRDSDVFHAVSSSSIDDALRSLERDTASVFQTAYELYRLRHFDLTEGNP